MPNVKLSPARKIVLELLHHARQVPSIPVARELNVATLAERRAALAERPSWTAIFMRAYGLACQEFRELRRAFLPYPRPRLYEHPYSKGSVVVERDVDGEPMLLAAKIRKPEEQSVATIQRALDRFKTAPLEQIGDFRQLIRFAKAPHLFRRFVFWHSLYFSGAIRAKRFGTFMLSSYGSLGAEQIHPITPLTTLFTFGPISADGRVVAKIIYDHRVMDGRVVARALGHMQRLLDQVLLEELAAPAARAA